MAGGLVDAASTSSPEFEDVTASTPSPHPARKLSVVVVHNAYQQAGGEDAVVRAEADMLRGRGHELREHLVSNKSIEGIGRVALFGTTLWNRDAYRQLVKVFGQSSAAIAHFHNTLPLISPAAYYAAHDQGTAVVQTLHNYRLLCPNGAFLRDGRVCELCLGKGVPWPGVVHACYRESRAASAAVASMLTVHRALGTWQKKVDVYIALTEFARRKFIEGGLPAEKIVVKPNFTSDPGIGRHDGGYVLFVGRLSPEKGVDVLFNAWDAVHRRHPHVRLKVAGTGPLENLLSDPPAGIDWLGWQSGASVRQLMQDASLLVMPSKWYEGFPMTIVEAFATGLPVAASGIGSLAELVRDGETGRLCRPGDPRELADVLGSMIMAPGVLAEMGANARRDYENRYTLQQNYHQLTAIYSQAVARRAGRAGGQRS
jgi:glycosyltransferase involved in cell wall biosynthesis